MIKMFTKRNCSKLLEEVEREDKCDNLKSNRCYKIVEDEREFFEYYFPQHSNTKKKKKKKKKKPT